MSSLLKPTTFRRQLAAVLLTASSVWSAAPTCTWGREPVNLAFPTAVPLMDRVAFEQLADEALNSSDEANVDLLELQNLKVQRFQELKGKIEDLSRLLEQQRKEAGRTEGSPAKPSPPTNSSGTPSPALPAGPSPENATNQTPKASGNPSAQEKPQSDKSDKSAPQAEPSQAREQTPPEQPAPEAATGQATGPAMSPQPLPQSLSSEQAPEPKLVQPPAWQERLSSTRNSTTNEELRNLPIIINSDKVEELGEESEEQGVVSGQIDRFSLACSLFGAGETEACLKVLGQTDVKKLSREDQLFVQYLQACCHRRAGRLDQAREIYRRVVVAPEADWMKDVATWWLDNLESKSVISGDIGRLQSTLAAWETELANVRTN